MSARRSDPKRTTTARTRTLTYRTARAVKRGAVRTSASGRAR